MIPVHIFGHPCDIEGLLSVANDYNITLIEDACATHTQERHDNSLKGVKGYCRIRKTKDILEEINP